MFMYSRLRIASDNLFVTILGKNSLAVYDADELVYNEEEISAISALIVDMIRVHCFAIPR